MDNTEKVLLLFKIKILDEISQIESIHSIYREQKFESDYSNVESTLDCLYKFLHDDIIKK